MRGINNLTSYRAKTFQYVTVASDLSINVGGVCSEAQPFDYSTSHRYRAESAL